MTHTRKSGVEATVSVAIICTSSRMLSGLTSAWIMFCRLSIVSAAKSCAATFRIA